MQKKSVFKSCLDANAFTLIELLVVVLIIGILAAVALPQYNLAVAKARVNRLLPLMKSIENAQEVYKIANGTYAADFTLLDIDMPAGAVTTTPQSIDYSNFVCGLYTNSLLCTDRQDSVALESVYNSHMICWAQNSTSSQSICKAVCKVNTLYTTGSPHCDFAHH